MAHGEIFKNKRNRIIENFMLDIDHGCKYIEKIQGGVQWYMRDREYVNLNISFESKN